MVFVLYSVLCALVLRKNWLREREADSAASLGWWAFIVAPFTVQSHTFASEFVGVQSLGIAAVGGALLAGDWWGGRHREATWDPGSAIERSVGVWLLVACAAAFITHLALMPEIPIVWKLAGLNDEAALVQLRERSSKLLPVPSAVVYLFQAAIEVLAPLTVVLLARSKRFLLSGFLICLSVVYSRATMARGPLLVFLTVFAAVVWALSSSAARRRFLRPAGVTLLVAVVSGGYLVAQAGPFGDRRPSIPHPTDSRLAVTLADEFRRQEPAPKGAAALPISVVYRWLLGPSEVSHRWYAYYPAVAGHRLGWGGMSRSERVSADFVHPATVVGRWAYVSRFPNQYYPTIRAYCSADADAYARWGPAGLVLVSVLLAALRIFVGRLRLPGPWGDAQVAAFGLLLGTGLPAASLQSLFVAHGVWILVALSVANSMAVRWRSGSRAGNGSLTVPLIRLTEGQ